MKPLLGNDPRQSGFSLIEVLVSAVVIGILATATFYFLSNQSSMGARGSDMMKGTNLGKLKMDSLKVMSYDGLTSGSDTVSERYIRVWQVGVVRDAFGHPNGRKSIELTVLWPLTGDQYVSFSSIKGDDKYKEGEQ